VIDTAARGAAELAFLTSTEKHWRLEQRERTQWQGGRPWNLGYRFSDMKL